MLISVILRLDILQLRFSLNSHRLFEDSNIYKKFIIRIQHIFDNINSPNREILLNIFPSKCTKE